MPAFHDEIEWVITSSTKSSPDELLSLPFLQRDQVKETLHAFRLSKRERNHDVDVAARAGRTLVAIEVKSGRRREVYPGAFVQAFRPARRLLAGADSIALEAFLSRPVEDCLQA